MRQLGAYNAKNSLGVDQVAEGRYYKIDSSCDGFIC